MSTTPLDAAPNAPRAPRTSQTLSDAREAFVAIVRRDTPGTDLPRYVAVLDSLLAWSAARPARLEFRADPGPAGVIRFWSPDTKRVVWTARTARGGAPTLELAPAAANAPAPAVPVDAAPVRISFGALKNAAALAAVLTRLDDLVDEPRKDRPNGGRDGAAAEAAEATEGA